MDAMATVVVMMMTVAAAVVVAIAIGEVGEGNGGSSDLRRGEAKSGRRRSRVCGGLITQGKVGQNKMQQTQYGAEKMSRGKTKELEKKWEGRPREGWVLRGGNGQRGRGEPWGLMPEEEMGKEGERVGADYCFWR